MTSATVPIQRCLLQGWVAVSLSVTFYFDDLSGVNSGIIATIFSTSVVYTTLIFRVKYGQILTRRDWLGCSVIIFSVVMICIGGAKSSISQDLDVSYLLLAVLCALGSGLVFSLNTFNVNFVVHDIKFPPFQMYYDGNLLFGIILAPLFVLELIRDPSTFTL